MRRNKHALAIAAAVAAVALALAGAAVAALTSRTASAGATVKVTEREYHLALSKTSIGSGLVVFSVHNAGHIKHAFAVAGAGVKSARTAAIAPGATKTLKVRLAGGTLHVWCPMPGHAALGMKSTLKVTGTSSGASVPGVSVTYGTTTDAGWG